MASPILDQRDIPTITALYEKGEIAPVKEEPIFAPSAELNSKVGLIRHDITKLRLPEGAIVNAANSSLLGGGGVDGAIHRAAGNDLYEECEALDGCRTGSAKMTNAYELPCKKIIHAVGPIYRSVGNPEDLLASCYETSLNLAVKAGLKVVAFSAISTGVYGYPSMEAADVVLETVRLFLDSPEGKKLDLVVFCNFEMKDMVAYHHMIPVYFPRVEETKDASDTASTEASAEATKGEDGAKSKFETSTADDAEEELANKSSTEKVEPDTAKPEETKIVEKAENTS